MPGLRAGREICAVERIAIVAIHVTACRCRIRRWGTTAEQRGQTEDRIGEVDRTIAVGITGIQAGTWWTTGKERRQQEDRIGEVEATVGVTVSATKERTYRSATAKCCDESGGQIDLISPESTKLPRLGDGVAIGSVGGVEDPGTVTLNRIGQIWTALGPAAPARALIWSV